MKFIHAADIHLDSPLVGLLFYEEAPVEEQELVRGVLRKASNEDRTRTYSISHATKTAG